MTEQTANERNSEETPKIAQKNWNEDFKPPQKKNTKGLKRIKNDVIDTRGIIMKLIVA